jgi:hypothetical protein
MPVARQQALAAIKVGDVIFGISAGGRGRLLLVYETTQDEFFARHVPSKARAKFGRDGLSRWCQGGGHCTIVSTAALPQEQYDVVIGLDRKRQRAGADVDQRLSKAEIQLLLTVDDFFKARPLPGGVPT